MYDKNVVNDLIDYIKSQDGKVDKKDYAHLYRINIIRSRIGG